jgi:hypothetical protein
VRTVSEIGERRGKAELNISVGGVSMIRKNDFKN